VFFAAISSPEYKNLGLCGAFAYYLAFQFATTQQHIDRAPADRDLVLHLPDAIVVRDRKRETCVRHAYEFTVPAGKGRPEAGTAGLDSITETTPKETTDKTPSGPEPGSYSHVVALAKEKFRREIGRAHVRTPVTIRPRMPSHA